jgi:hypothetical protein
MKYHVLDLSFLEALQLGIERYLTCKRNITPINLLSLDPEVVEREMAFTLTEYRFNEDVKAPFNYVLSQVMNNTSRIDAGNANVIGQLMLAALKADGCYERDIEDVYMSRVATAASSMAHLLTGESKECMRACIISEVTIRTLFSCGLNNTPKTEDRCHKHLAVFNLNATLDAEIMTSVMDRIAKIEAMFLAE